MNEKTVFTLELVEWFDQSGREIAHRFPQEGSADIKYGAQLVVRESQTAILFYNGRAVHIFGPGRHTLKTANIPVLSRVMGLPWGLESPLRAEVYLINTKVFTNLKWGTREPVAFKDAELGVIRLRAFGIFNIQVVEPLVFINSLVGTMASFTVEDLSDYLAKVILYAFNDFLGENIDTILNLPKWYEEWSAGLKDRLQHEFTRFGLALTQLYINSITPPPEVQKALDDRSKLGMFEDLGKLMQLKAATAMEKAAENQGTSGESTGLGVGFMMPSLMAQAMQQAASAQPAPPTPANLACPHCKHPVRAQDSFCTACGQNMKSGAPCATCSQIVSAGAFFCPHCGAATGQNQQLAACPHCGQQNQLTAKFCNHCGERIQNA